MKLMISDEFSSLWQLAFLHGVRNIKMSFLRYLTTEDNFVYLEMA